MNQAAMTICDTKPETSFPRLGRVEGRLFGVIVAAFIGLQTSPASADLVSPFGGETAPNFAEITVLKDRVHVALEIDLSDYRNFVAEDDGTKKSLAERTGRTLTIAADGVAIEPVVRLVDVRKRKPRIRSARRLSPRQRSGQVVYAELDFMFEGLPKTITLTPPLEADGTPAASLGMLVEHAGVPVTDYRYLSVPETLVLDWHDPWFSAFENPNLRRHHKSPLMSFVVVEPREVRHEIILRLRDLEQWSDIDLGDAKTLTATQMGEVKRRAAAFFAGRKPIKIDERFVSPADISVSQISVGVDGLKVLEDVAVTDRATALLGIILTYHQAALPSNVELAWDLFPKGAGSVPVKITDPAGGLPSQVTPDDPTITWTNFLKTWHEPASRPITFRGNEPLAVPYLTATLAMFGLAAVAFAVRKPSAARRRGWGAIAIVAVLAAVVALPVKATVPIPNSGQLDTAAAQEVMAVLLDNVGATILENDQKRFSETLAPFVLPKAIDAVGAEIQRGLSVTLPSGARARIASVDELQVEEISPTSDGNGHQVLASWNAEVVGSHWGHAHQRLVRYRGLFDLFQVDGDWYLGALTVLGAQTQT